MEGKKSTICHRQAGGPGKLTEFLYESGGLRNRGHKGVSPSPSPEAGEPGAPTSQGKKSFLCLFAQFRPSADGMTLLMCVRVVLFPHSTNSNLNLFQRQPPRHTKK